MPVLVCVAGWVCSPKISGAVVGSAPSALAAVVHSTDSIGKSSFTLAFVLRPQSNVTSRLLVRERYAYRQLWARRMLHGIRGRAEGKALWPVRVPISAVPELASPPSRSPVRRTVQTLTSPGALLPVLSRSFGPDMSTG